MKYTISSSTYIAWGIIFGHQDISTERVFVSAQMLNASYAHASVNEVFIGHPWAIVRFRCLTPLPRTVTGNARIIAVYEFPAVMRHCQCHLRKISTRLQCVRRHVRLDTGRYRYSISRSRLMYIRCGLCNKINNFILNRRTTMT